MVRCVREMSKRVTPVNGLLHARRELTMIRRIVLLISILLTLGVPYTTFVFMSFFNDTPEYHFRIAYLFADVSLVFVMIVLFQITDPIKTSVIKRIKNGRLIAVMPTVT